MTAPYPVASRAPDRTGVCCAGRSAPSQCEMVTGPGFSSPNQPDQERTTAYRDRSGPDSRSDAHCATTVGDWEEPSGESRFRCVIRERAHQPTRIYRQESGHVSLCHAESSNKRRMFRRVCARRRAIRAGGGRRQAFYEEVRCGVWPDDRSTGFVACLVRPIGAPPPMAPMLRGRGHGRAASAAQRSSGSVC